VPTDLQIVKDVSSSVLRPGESMTYTLTVRNNGPGDAADVVVSDENRPGFTLTAAAGGEFSCASTASGFSCSLPFLASGAQASVTLTAVVAAGAVNGQVLENIATVTSSTPDSNPSNNTDNAVSAVAAGDLPRTGADTGLWVRAALALLLGGVFVLLVTRRRRGRAVPTGS
jgi:uncharacterized repeat protein (TIGR01451 family)/LPXTG-motif cell wall-anchored protein